jgi:hypothetical protein
MWMQSVSSIFAQGFQALLWQGWFHQESLPQDESTHIMQVSEWFMTPAETL